MKFTVSAGEYTIQEENGKQSISIEDAKLEGTMGLEISAKAGVGAGAGISLV